MQKARIERDPGFLFLKGQASSAPPVLAPDCGSARVHQASIE